MDITGGTEENHEIKNILNQSSNQVDFNLDHMNMKQDC
jgi:hypothetical protein